MNDSTIPRDAVVIRNVTLGDEHAIVAIDAHNVGHRRDEFFKLKLRQALADTGIAVSLAAEIDGLVVGFLLARVYFGEFGMLEKVAVMDVLGVHPDFVGRGVAAGLIDQLRTNLLGLGIKVLQTQVGWDSPELIAFFQKAGFRLAPRLSLDLDLERTRH